MKKILVQVVLWGLVGALVFGLLYACAPPPVTSGNVSVREPESALKRLVDREAGIVCEVYYASASGVAMSCLPISETRLK